MGEKTNNVPPEWQEATLDAIAQAQKRREEMEASGQLMDMDAVLKEIYTQLLMKSIAANEDEFQHKAYVAHAMRRVVRWCLNFAKEYPPTHRKGYGTAGIETFDAPNALVFKFGSGIIGGPPPGDGDADWPEPEEVPDDLEGGWYTIDAPGDMVSFFHQRWDEMDIGGRSRELASHGASDDEYRELQAGALFQIAREWRGRGNDYIYLYPKSGGTNYDGKAEDIILLRTRDGNIYWKDVIIGTGSDRARLEFGAFRISGEPDKFVEP